MHAFILLVLASAYLAAAETIVITVGGNSTDGTTTFDPPSVDAVLGDTVIFNFTSGNHTATQSTFGNPCIPAHDTNVTINGFDSGFRNTTPGTSGSILSVPILEQNQNQTFWFFDFNTCGEGGVGAINDNESSTETLVGFVRNAIRLNGTNSSDTNSGTSTSSRTPSSVTSSPKSSSAAERTFAIGTFGVVPLFIASLFV